MIQTDSRYTRCAHVILYWLGIAAELPAEPLDSVSLEDQASISVQSSRNPHPPGIDRQAIEPIERMRGDRCSRRDEEAGLSCTSATRLI